MGVLDRLLAPFTVLGRLTALEARMEAFDAALGRIDAATTAVAEEIRELKDQIAAGGLTPEQEADVLARLEAAAARLEGIGADPENPVPEA